MAAEECKYSFVVEWYDPQATLNRKYLLNFFDNDGTVEMYDPKNRRVFLRRCKAENIRLADMYVGNSVNVMSRQLKFVDYGDDFTKRQLGYRKEMTFGLIKPDAVTHMGRILDIIWQAGLQITQMKMVRLSRQEASDFHNNQKATGFFNDILSHMISGPMVAIEMRAENAVQRWLDIIGPSDPSQARKTAPSSLRARFGTDCVQNAAHGSETAEIAAKELDFFFPREGAVRQNTACFSESTCCVIKPHAVCDGVAGDIINKIIECGFDITALVMVTLERANAEEFLEVYKGVVQEYPSMVTELSSGPCIALEIRAQDAARTFREFVGPADPEIARHLRPRTLRALFGRTKTQNAVHCTDLPEDAQLEVEYFFSILDR